MTSFRVSRDTVVNGEDVRFFGRLKGRQFGSSGQADQPPGVLAWALVDVRDAARKPPNGAVEPALPIQRDARLVRYRFRALVPREASFPYDTGASRSRIVKVRGL